MEDSSSTLAQSFTAASVSPDGVVEMASLEDIPTDASDEDSPYMNMINADHVVLETKSFYTKATDVDNHESARQIPLSTLAQGGEGSEENKFENAALIALEGERNEKLSWHPSGRFRRCRLLAYKIHHNPFFYTLCLINALVLMGLAIQEEPTVTGQQLTQNLVAAHIAELCLLFLILIDFVLRLMWQGVKSFFSHRNVFMTALLISLMIEVGVIIYRNERHPRYTRALRPIFLVDAYLMYGVRRVLRQITLCLANIFDVMVVLFYLIMVFAIAAYLLFINTDQTYFQTLSESFVSLIVTLTTANHPDVFLEAYFRNILAPLFFVIYLFITLYYFYNVLLAVVFSKFRDEEKDKFKNIYMRKREALLAVFHLLQKDNGINYHDFVKFMEKFKPLLPMHKVTFVYKSLQTNQEVPCTALTSEEFTHLYIHLGLNWKKAKDYQFNLDFFERNRSYRWLGWMIRVLRDWVQHWTFNSFMSLIVFLNMCYVITFVVWYFDYNCVDNCTRSDFARRSLPGSIAFTAIYVVELILKFIFHGWKRFLSKGRNRADIIIITVSVICILGEAITINRVNYIAEHLVFARSLKLLRFIRLKNRYYTFVRIIKVLMLRLFSVLVLLFVVYYFYAIVGMELFGGPDSRVYQGCCNTSKYDVGQYYTGSGGNSANLYWLNNFDNLYRSFITLYEEMVVNNWFIQMEGFVSTTSNFARIYFIAFWLTTTIVVNINIVYFLDAFETGVLEAKRNKKTQTKLLKKEVRITFTPEDVDNFRQETKVLDALKLEKRHNCIVRMKNYFFEKIKGFRKVTPKDVMAMTNPSFIGKRIMTNEDLRQEMYKGEIEEWIAHREELREAFASIKNPIRRRTGGKLWWKRMVNLTKKAKIAFINFVVYVLE